jgi:hypothetical protein
MATTHYACSVCTKSMRTDHLVRHMATHTQELIAAMSKEHIDLCKTHKVPVVFNLTSRNSRQNYCICLNCKKGSIGFLQRNDPKKFFHEHCKSDCVNHFDKFAKLYDDVGVTVPTGETTKIQLKTRAVTKDSESSEFSAEFIRLVKETHGDEDDIPTIKRLEDIVNWFRKQDAEINTLRNKLMNAENIMEDNKIQYEEEITRLKQINVGLVNSITEMSATETELRNRLSATPAPEPVAEPVAIPEPEVAPEPVAEPEVVPEPVAEPVVAPEPVAEPVVAAPKRVIRKAKAIQTHDSETIVSNTVEITTANEDTEANSPIHVALLEKWRGGYEQDEMTDCMEYKQAKQSPKSKIESDIVKLIDDSYSTDSRIKSETDENKLKKLYEIKSDTENKLEKLYEKYVLDV